MDANTKLTETEKAQRLAAAAPELLAALTVIARAIERGNYFDPANAIKLARAAISKATGEAA